MAPTRRPRNDVGQAPPQKAPGRLRPPSRSSCLRRARPSRATVNAAARRPTCSSSTASTDQAAVQQAIGNVKVQRQPAVRLLGHRRVLGSGCCRGPTNLPVQAGPVKPADTTTPAASAPPSAPAPRRLPDLRPCRRPLTGRARPRRSTVGSGRPDRDAWHALRLTACCDADRPPAAGGPGAAGIAVSRAARVSAAAAGRPVPRPASWRSVAVWLAGPGRRRAASGALPSCSRRPLRRHAVREVVGFDDPPGARLLDAVAVMDRLRSPGGCPWDAEQTTESLSTTCSKRRTRPTRPSRKATPRPSATRSGTSCCRSCSMPASPEGSTRRPGTSTTSRPTWWTSSSVAIRTCSATAPTRATRSTRTASTRPGTASRPSRRAGCR